MHLTTRLARQDDAPEIYTLLADYSAHVVDDYEEITPQFAVELATNGHTAVIVDQFERLHALVWFSDINHGLHMTFHGLCRPESWLSVRRGRLTEAILDEAFKRSECLKIKAMQMRSQKTAGKVLKFLGFQRLKPELVAETRRNGKPEDVIVWQLTRKYWESRR